MNGFTKCIKIKQKAMVTKGRGDDVDFTLISRVYSGIWLLWDALFFTVASGDFSWDLFSLLVKYMIEPSVTFILLNACTGIKVVVTQKG